MAPFRRPAASHGRRVLQAAPRYAHDDGQLDLVGRGRRGVAVGPTVVDAFRAPTERSEWSATFVGM